MSRDAAVPSITWEKLPSSGLVSLLIPKGEDEAPPPGYLTGGQVLDRLLAIWWGTSACHPDGEIVGEPVERGNLLCDAVLDGRLYECAQLLRDAAKGERIHGIIRKDNADRTLMPADWSERSAREWAFDLLDGVLERSDHQPTGWANGWILFFDQNAITEWLAGLSSPHLLPSPLKRDPAGLADGPVTLWQALTWLAQGESHKWCEEISPSDEGVRNAIADLARPEIDRFEPAVFLARYLAHREREAQAADSILAELRAGRLTAFGVQSSGRGFVRGHDSAVSEVPRQAFLTALKLGAADTIGPDRHTREDAWRLAAETGTWEQVVFDRDELLRLWAGPQSSDAIDSATGATRRFSLRRAKDAYRERVNNWPKDERHPSREDDVAWLRESFHVPRDTARRIRNEMAPASWSKPGAPKSSHR